ncbi:MAG: Glyoxalase/bleomycin resistance protein/dioxygenase [Solirubrobacterales bacterium]|nr:Glyoxalase/bleomycin resistance protein/dioxygenase [Solirubrobacterales bacterium]
MALEGLHHITAITGDAPANVEFYTRLLGLRMVKKTVNFDAPDVYHLYYGDDRGTPGSILTFFEFPGAAPGRPGDGMVHRILWRVGSEAALDFWSQRLGTGPVFADPEGLEHELVVVAGADAPLSAAAADIPPEHALQGFHGVRAYAAAPWTSRALLEALGFAEEGPGSWRLTGAQRHGLYHYAPPPDERGIPGAGTIHHVAWSAADDAELTAYRERAVAAGAHPTHIIDLQYFHSVYFREPSGVLFELASRDIGFAVDEPLETLGRALKLPAQHEHLRAQLEQTLTPLP